jgi:DNA repair exonuclease SbcCD ATPase subunit
MPKQSVSKLRLPRIKRVQLRQFTLFAANPNAVFDAGNGVLCLIGANGVGKSTLLAAINYCLTGTVPDPSRVFESMDEYYKYTRSYSGNYFRGRIAGSDEDEAEITVTFTVGDVEYELTRGLFEPEELRGLKITSTSQPVAQEADDIPRRERHQRYTASLVENTGVASFQEFVFLQHFVFTFDEQRKTLFWNLRILERVLYRAFGLDPNMATQADSLRREIQHEDSRVRNRQWEATRMRKRINEIRAQTQAVAGAQTTYDTLVASHEQLSKDFEEHSKDLHESEEELRDANLRLADLSVRETALRDEYASFFERRFDSRPPLEKHPFISQSLSQHQCELCGHRGKQVEAAIAKKAQGSTCPLCDSAIVVKPPDPAEATRLKELDKELTTIKRTVADTHKNIQSLRKKEEAARNVWDITKEKLDEFDRQNDATLESLRTLLSTQPGAVSLSDYRDQLAVIEKEQKTAYNKREALKKELRVLKQTLEEHYIEVEKSFVPIFNDLAQRFLGMPLTVQMDTRTGDDVKLVVSVRGTTRRHQQNLSESQRFFLDIALRMALTQHMSDENARGGMLIDTPEGSLDIAYEKRAGDMLARFALAGFQIVMTANLNSSKLLLALAADCGPSHMTICRMTDWAELSEVQQEEEGLFDEAYAQIEKAMADSAIS